MKVVQMTEAQIKRLITFFESNTDLTENEILRCLAYAEMQGYKISDLKGLEFKDNTITDGRREYLVLTDEEANDKWDESLDSYLDEILHKYLQRYFDCEAWKSDARNDGRGHYLAAYDGDEIEVCFFDEYFFIYRIN